MQLSTKILALTITLHNGGDCVQAFTSMPSFAAGTTTTSSSSSRTKLHVGMDTRRLEVEAAILANGKAKATISPGKEEQATRNYARLLPDLDETKENNESELEMNPDHLLPLGSWTAEQIEKSRAENPFLMAFGPGKSRHNLPTLTHGEGVYLYDVNGKQYLDWTSQAVCANLGQDIPQSILDGVQQQMKMLPYTMGDLGFPEIRARTNQLLREILPGTLGPALFPSSGAEANEAAIRMARRYTGKHKILSWYRSYHGATGHAGAATGDCRRWVGSDQNPGFIKAFSPFPLFFSHRHQSDNNKQDQDDDDNVEAALQYMEELILNEGPDEIAAIMTESIMGAGGVLIFPTSYMQGLRALCDKYDILMIMDEVMVGFGRTGKMFGFEHYEGVVPDIVTAAKGLSTAALPLSMTACTDEIMEFFEDKPLGYGSTYQAHPVAMACAYENVKYLLQKDIIGGVQDIAPLFESQIKELCQGHPCVKQYRAIGLFGALDVKNPDGSIPKLQHDGADAAFAAYVEAYKNVGLMGLHRYPHIHCAPPLIISEEELIDGFSRLDQALTVLDEALGYGQWPGLK